ncbi:hypothetical protein Tsubulata_018997 [Turnera subulata]|uniref:Uncharacterized protein n=1 Tax=Turnera subulata TaxID=218843 RepID=A0A9Q0GK04_9ROSI|nr:hypothetical protein Tsubulata_018997 [Turnera subulata]
MISTKETPSQGRSERGGWRSSESRRPTARVVSPDPHSTHSRAGRRLQVLPPELPLPGGRAATTKSFAASPSQRSSHQNCCPARFAIASHREPPRPNESNHEGAAVSSACCSDKRRLAPLREPPPEGTSRKPVSSLPRRVTARRGGYGRDQRIPQHPPPPSATREHEHKAQPPYTCNRK